MQCTHEHTNHTALHSTNANRERTLQPSSMWKLSEQHHLRRPLGVMLRHKAVCTRRHFCYINTMYIHARDFHKTLPNLNSIVTANDLTPISTHATGCTRADRNQSIIFPKQTNPPKFSLHKATDVITSQNNYHRPLKTPVTSRFNMRYHYRHTGPSPHNN